MFGGAPLELSVSQRAGGFSPCIVFGGVDAPSSSADPAGNVAYYDTVAGVVVAAGAQDPATPGRSVLEWAATGSSVNFPHCAEAEKSKRVGSLVKARIAVEGAGSEASSLEVILDFKLGDGKVASYHIRYARTNGGYWIGMGSFEGAPTDISDFSISTFSTRCPGVTLP